MKLKTKREKRIRRHNRVRSVVQGTADRPRLAVFRSNKHITVQAIIDDQHTTVCAASDAEVGKEAKGVERSKEIGKLIAKRLKEKGVEKAVFDRGGYRYHGNVKAVAEGAREAGLVL